MCGMERPGVYIHHSEPVYVCVLCVQGGRIFIFVYMCGAIVRLVTTVTIAIYVQQWYALQRDKVYMHYLMHAHVYRQL